jgi:PAS domain S-box-containing protein
LLSPAWSVLLRQIGCTPLLTIPHLGWLKRLTLFSASALIAFSGTLFAAWWLRFDDLLPFDLSSSGTGSDGAAAFFVVGAALLAYQLGYARLAWIAVAPALLGLLYCAQTWFFPGLGVELWFSRSGPAGYANGSGMHAASALCLVLAGATIASLGTGRIGARRAVFLAFAGSVSAAIGLGTIGGYFLGMPAVCRWGSEAALPETTAIMLVLLGLSSLAVAWREQQGSSPGAPAWLPMPVMIGSAALTAVLWLGLREAESLHLATGTQIALRDFAASVGRTLQRHRDALERLARRHAEQNFTGSEADWSDEARIWRQDAPGCFAVVLIEPTLRTTATDAPQSAEHLIGLDHGADPVRASALQRAAQSGSAEVTGTLKYAAGPGFALYAPILDDGIRGYVGADFLYRRFFGSIQRELKLQDQYRVVVFVGGEEVYADAHNTPGPLVHELQEIFDVADRRIRVAVTPSAEYLQKNRRHLPEFALAAGCGITLLLGLSVHLSRTARSGLRAAKQSNQQLLAENDERRRVEEMLKVSDERLRLALDSTQIGIFEWNLPANRLYYSDGVWAMLGYSPASIPATPEAWAALIHPADLTGYRAAVEKQLTGETPFIDPEYRVRAANLEWRWIYARARSVATSPAGRPERIIGTLQDITARKRAEEALRQSQATTRKLSLVASRTDNLVIIASPDGTIEWVNESFERVMEYRLDEVVGRSPAFMIGPETSIRTVRQIQVAMRRGEGLSTDLVNYSKSGKKYYLHLEIQPVRNEAGVLENFIGIQADITARVETENNLRRAKAEADAASRAKSEFLASMSHEIRTPMNGVIGMTSLLLDTHLSHEQRDYVNTIRNSGEALLTIINDILDFSKIESGKMELENLPFELAVCIEDALDLFAVQAQGKKLELTYHVDESVPTWIQGDVTRLRQVLVNLVNNAVKFTPSGSVAIKVRALDLLVPPGQNPNLMTLEFSVIDTGIGIPPDRLHRLFRPFSQVDSSTTRKYGGTGLGLAICHRLCALMGGEIGVDSTVGLGSTFRFTMKSEAVNTPPGWGYPELPVRLNYGDVLCIEDHPVAQERLRTFFGSWGARVICAASAESALEHLKGDPAPIAILLDYEMTESAAGIELREAICSCDIPTLVLLATGQSSQHLEMFAGRRGVTTANKPVRTHALIRGIQTLFDNPPDSLPPFVISNDVRLLAHDLPLDILLVEDNAVNQKVALRFLDRLGYRADAVANGLEALQTLQSRHYQLVLMDLQMPEMDGFEATRQIRRRLPADRQPKIIALTANALHGDREQCLAAGMDDYITKPVKLLDIAQAIRRQFSLGSRAPMRALN